MPISTHVRRYEAVAEEPGRRPDTAPERSAAVAASSPAQATDGTATTVVQSDSTSRQRWWRVLRRDRAATLGGAVFLGFIVIALTAPFLAPFDPYELRPQYRLAPPGTGPYLLGGDELGRDVLSRLIWGTRASLLIGFTPVLIGGLLGGLLGLWAGLLGGIVDDITMRILEVFQAFPSILLALGIAAAIGPGLVNVIISLTVISVPYFARVVRSSTIGIREQEFISAALGLGASMTRIAYRHVLPNVLSPIIVLVTLQGGRMILLGAGLSFLGLGIRPPDPDWGAMLSSGHRFVSNAPHIATIPGLVIFVVTAGLNLLGDGLRDALDPHHQSR
jgi:peptide/nickel transport system permease protein